MDAPLSTTLQHTISFLLNPLSSHFPSQTLDALHNSLLSSFSSLTSTKSTAPFTFLLSPTAPAPPVIQRALLALPSQLRVQWADWILLLANGNQVVLTIALNPGLVTAAIRNAKTGTVDFRNIWDAKREELLRAAARRTPSPWGPPSLSARSRSSAAHSTTSSSSATSADDLDLDLSLSSRSSSPEVVAVEAAETVLSGAYDDDDEQQQMLFGRFAGLRLGAPSPMTTIRGPSQKVPAQQQQPSQKASLSAVAAEWFPRAGGLHAKTASIASLSSFAPSVPPRNGGSSCGSGSGALTPGANPRLLPTPIGAHRTMPTGAGRGHSRSSSRSSTLSTPSLVSSSVNTSVSLSPTSSSSSTNVPPSPTASDMSDANAEPTVLYIDSSKDQQAVTEYECGKVGVLTGAVMLGVPKNSVPGGWKKQVQGQVRRA